MAAVKKGKSVEKNSTQEFFDKIKNTEVSVNWESGSGQTLTPENLEKFILGEMTWAQVQGVSMEQCYAFAEFGYNLFEQGKYEEAQKVFEGLVVLNPYDAYFHAVLGSIFARQNRADEAIKEFSVAAQIDPTNAQVLVNRAELYLRKGQFEGAMGDLQKAIAIDPKSEEPAVGRARTLAAATAGLIEEILKSKNAPVKPKVKKVAKK